MSEQASRRPTERFTTKARAYAKYRPGYPIELLHELTSRGAMGPASIIADIGSGTGLLSDIFVQSGHLVLGIEPNGPMRLEAERCHRSRKNFVSIDARAEATTLPDGSIDLIVVGQAFHWFELVPTRAEFERVLRKGGAVAIIWNERQDQGEGFLADYDRLLDKHCAQHNQIGRVNVDVSTLASFFSPGKMVRFTLPNWQDVDLEGAKGRLTSSSYAPDPDQPGYEKMMLDLTAIFEKYQENGRVRFSYDTEVYLGHFEA